MNLVFVCFSVAGLVFFISGLRGLVYHAAVWLFTPTRPPFEFKAAYPAIVTAAFQTAVGLWLLCRFRGILRGLRWLLQSGRTLGIRKTEEE
jgi:hypothetical protein